MCLMCMLTPGFDKTKRLWKFRYKLQHEEATVKEVNSDGTILLV